MKPNGFSLLEVAIGLFLITLLVGSLLVPLSTQADARLRAEAQKQLLHIREALIGFAIANGRLPRPAQSEVNGQEKASCTTEADCTGYLPWESLGVGNVDPWGKRLRYSVTPAFATTGISYGTATAPRTVGTKIVQDRGTTSPFALVTIAGASDAKVAAVILSHGRDNWGVGQQGNAMGDLSTTNSDEDTNAAATTTFISRTPSSNTGATGGEFDDLVTYIKDLDVFGAMIKAGKLP